MTSTKDGCKVVLAVMCVAGMHVAGLVTAALWLAGAVATGFLVRD
jgi:hypothetical protein